ncbi:membrane protein insertion efficiency factor YidD [Candidatus Poribacteria bacterium]
MNRNLTIKLIAAGIAILLNTILPCRASSAQESTELEFILSHNPIQGAPQVVHLQTHSRVSYTPEIKTLLLGAIRFYQRFISTQDGPSCTFVPSCSRFGGESIRRLGVVRGILLTSDRLQRCNSVSTSRYQVDSRSGYLMDPVRVYEEILQ